MKNDDVSPIIRKKLNEIAHQHPDRHQVMHNVMQHVQKQSKDRFKYTWKLSGLAFAAALTGFLVLPIAPTLNSEQSNQVNIDPKLSPQLLEDIDMLMVFAEDTNAHGS